MTCSNALMGIIVRDEPLARYTSFRIGGPAEYVARPRSLDELRAVISWSRSEGLPWRVLGCGTNVLVADEGIAGLVVSLEDGAFRTESVQGSRIVLGAGWRLSRLVGLASKAGLSGAESLVGIPGTVGAAIVMNAGGRYGSLGDVLSSVRLVRPDGTEDEVRHAEMGLGYRSSVLGGCVVVEATCELTEAHRRSIEAEQKRIYEEKRATQPLWERSAGCVFKNPPGKSAGQLIDSLGLKGLSRGDACISMKHANFIVNRGRACAADVLGLIEDVRRRVGEAFGVDLELELVVWRDCR